METKTIQLANGIRLEYVEQGASKGPALICPHGFTDSWRSFELILPYLPPNLRVMALSQRGHGRSDRPAEGYTPRDFATDLALFMDALHLDAAMVMGHSMGATIAQRFALDYPQKTRALILIGAIASFPPNASVAELKKAVDTLTDPVPLAFAEEFQRSTLVRPVNPQFIETVVKESLLLPARVWKAVLGPLMLVDYTAELHLLKMPVLMVCGGEDSFATAWDQDWLQQSINGAQMVVYEGTGHAVHWEEPQRVAGEVEAFIRNIKTAL